jgi:hypothetical protein
MHLIWYILGDLVLLCIKAIIILTVAVDRPSVLCMHLLIKCRIRQHWMESGIVGGNLWYYTNHIAIVTSHNVNKVDHWNGSSAVVRGRIFDGRQECHEVCRECKCAFSIGPVFGIGVSCRLHDGIRACIIVKIVHQILGTYRFLQIAQA